MAEGGQIQLLPSTRKKISYTTPGQNKLLFTSLGFVALVFIIYGGLLYYKSIVLKDLDKINSQLIQNEKSRSKADENTLIRLKQSLDLAIPLLNDHISSSEAILKLQKVINPQVQIDSLSIKSDSGQYSFKAFAANFAVVAKQIAAFYDDDTVTGVLLNKVSSLTNGTVEFSAIVDFDVNKTLKKNLFTK